MFLLCFSANNVLINQVWFDIVTNSLSLYFCFLFPNIMLLKVYRKFKCNDNNNPQSKRANLYVRRGLDCLEPKTNNEKYCRDYHGKIKR